MTPATPIFASDIQLASDFCKENPHLFPSGESSLKSQTRNRRYNGLTEAGAVVKRMGHLFIVKPNYLAWFAGRSE
jgi:hypothetical protein